MISLNIRLVLLTIFLLFVITGSLIVLDINRNVVINPYKKYVVVEKYDDWEITSWLEPENIFPNQNFVIGVTIKYLGTKTYRAYVVFPIAHEITVRNAENGSIVYSFVAPTITRLETIKPGTTYNFSIAIGPGPHAINHVFVPGKYIVELKVIVPATNSSGVVDINLRLNVR